MTGDRCRSALTVHRGTAHPSPVARPVLVLGVGTPGTGHSAGHDIMVTTPFYDRLPEFVRKHLVCRVVENLEGAADELVVKTSCGRASDRLFATLVVYSLLMRP